MKTLSPNKIFNKIKSRSKQNQGFTLLFAVLVSSLVLSVGASVISIALRQLVISSTGRDSQYAFYAANTGIECAMYWDLKRGSNFATSTQSANFAGPMDCESVDVSKALLDAEENFTVNKKSTTEAETSFRLEFGSVGPESIDVPYCVDVIVKKRQETNHDTGQLQIRTEIVSRGYNTCDSGNARRIERGLEARY